MAPLSEEQKAVHRKLSDNLDKAIAGADKKPRKKKPTITQDDVNQQAIESANLEGYGNYEPKQLYSDPKLFYIDSKEVIVHDRVRITIDPDAMRRLTYSIRTRGQYLPIVLTEKNELVSGFRRLTACRSLHWPVLACRKGAFSEVEALEHELCENTDRCSLSALDEVLGQWRLHNLRKTLAERDGHVWGVRESAELVGGAKTTIADDIKMGEAIALKPSAYKDCKSKHDIKVKMKEEEKRIQWLNLQSRAQAQEAKEIESFIPPKLPGDTHPKLDYIPEAPKPEDLSSDLRVSYDKSKMDSKLKQWQGNLGIGDCYQELPKIKDSSINLFLLDMPWGLEIQEKVESGMLKGKAYEDSFLDFKTNFPRMVKLAWEKMASDSYLFTFFRIDLLKYVYDMLDAVGFTVNRRPLIMLKEGVKTSRQPEFWHGSTYEPLAMARKGSRKLNVNAPADHFRVKWHRMEAKMAHPSAKPPEAYVKILSWVALPGDIVCDPMYGTGAAFVACELMPELHLRWFGWDKESENQAKSLTSLVKHTIQQE